MHQSRQPRGNNKGLPLLEVDKNKRKPIAEYARVVSSKRFCVDDMLRLQYPLSGNKETSWTCEANAAQPKNLAILASTIRKPGP